MDLKLAQLELEKEMVSAGVVRFNKNNDRAIEGGQAGDTQWFRRLTREFVKPMADALQAYKDYYNGRSGRTSATLTSLNCLTNEQAAFIAIKTIFDSLTTGETPAQHLAIRIGGRVEDEIRFSKLSDTSPEYINSIKESLKKRLNKSYTFERDSLVHAEKELKLLSDFQALSLGGVDKLEIMRLLDIGDDKYNRLSEKAEYAVDIDRWLSWSQTEQLHVGAKLIDIFANNMLLDGLPIVKKVNVSTGHSGKKRTPAAIVPTSALEAWVEEYKEVMQYMSPAYAPCVIQPRDWTSPFNGGYHCKDVARRIRMVKHKDKEHVRTLTRKKMPRVYQAINKLQSVAWKVNEPLLAIANEIRLRGLPLGMPQMDKLTKPLCPVPAIYAELRGAELMACLDEDQKEAFMQWKRDTVTYYKEEQERKADVRTTIATIDQALKFKDFDELFFVYTLDFRSRVYCQSSLLSPQGGDLSKALLPFAEAKPLGKTGEYWFKVQGANVWGWDKEDFDERVSRCETEDFKEMCLDIAADPISFTEWTAADKPWQFLSWCLEYADLIEHVEDGNDAKTFKSRIPVAMDGSCSGIQHYSAMLRDEVGGAAVNLVPSDKPQDIYNEVALVVKSWMESIIEDHTQDVPDWGSISAKFGNVTSYKYAEEWLRISIKRGMTKKPVMTLPYGSSQLTCRDSISDYLNDLQAKANKQALASGMPTGNIHNFTNAEGEMPIKGALSFASGMTWSAIGEVVIAARAAMRYIKNLTKLIAQSGNSFYIEAPTGFVVKQTIYEETKDKQVFTSMLGGCKFRVTEQTSIIDVVRMQSSCAPNFVHTMDASHLILSVCYFDIAKINSIAVIHDSFGTHACDTEELRYLLRRSFVDMYLSYDVIQHVKDFNEEVHMMEFDVEVPEKGNLVLEDIMDSKYTFG